MSDITHIAAVGEAQYPHPDWHKHIPFCGLHECQYYQQVDADYSYGAEKYIPIYGCVVDVDDDVPEACDHCAVCLPALMLQMKEGE